MTPFQVKFRPFRNAEERRKLVKGKQDGSATDMQEKWKKLLGSALSSHKEQRKSSKISLISYKRKCEISKEIIFLKKKHTNSRNVRIWLKWD